MTSPVITLRADVPVHLAAALLASHGFTAAPVVDHEDRVVRIASEADLVRGRIRPGAGVVDECPEPMVAAVMSPVAKTMGPADDLADVATLMLDSGIRSVPILDRGTLVGIVTRRDVLRAVARRELTSEDVWRRRGVMASHDRGEPDTR
jgi:predicted transcriptional regulator